MTQPTREQERAARLAELKTLMFFLVLQPITWRAALARRDLVRREPPRWKPDRARAKYVGDPTALQSPP